MYKNICCTLRNGLVHSKFVCKLIMIPINISISGLFSFFLWKKKLSDYYEFLFVMQSRLHSVYDWRNHRMALCMCVLHLVSDKLWRLPVFWSFWMSKISTFITISTVWINIEMCNAKFIHCFSDKHFIGSFVRSFVRHLDCRVIFLVSACFSFFFSNTMQHNAICTEHPANVASIYSILSI